MAKDYSHCKLIHRQAVQAAQQASEEKAVEVGDNWWPCGFAWVRVSPATQDFGRYLKKAGVVDGTAFGGGLSSLEPIRKQYAEHVHQGGRSEGLRRCAVSQQH